MNQPKHVDQSQANELMRAFVQGAEWWEKYLHRTIMKNHHYDMACFEAERLLTNGALGQPTKTETIMEIEDEARTQDPA